MAKEYPSRHQLCSQGSFYIKFQIAYDGNIQNISATKGADSLVINLFKSSIKATEKYWKVTKPNQSEVLLLPIQYNYMAGCRNDNSVMQLQQTFVFDDGTPLSFLSCSVLSPLIQVVNKGQEELK
ncbi:hypothetical protein [Spirosoma endbachense]|uniref:TonB C-terminal domain-containing protein n=1 Tax=Spirosoma endbachense TaxID=2666025 RepID=A0A6P1W612_9BACT|nr:hypothetical protein [Spirosoma endbachense]QHV99998.1 hypothetical protein GJR95_35500 [Spirosoma endbachense]